MKIYNKLVRDNIPAIIEKDGKKAEVSTLDTEAFIQALKDKLVEEAQEVTQTHTSEELVMELADIQEIIDALKDEYGISSSDINMAQAIKAIKNGKFKNRTFLIKVEEK